MKSDISRLIDNSDLDKKISNISNEIIIKEWTKWKNKITGVLFKLFPR